MKSSSIYLPLKMIKSFENNYPRAYEVANDSDVDSRKGFEKVLWYIQEFFERKYAYTTVTEVKKREIESTIFSETWFAFATQEWIKSKQVYSFPREFFEMLANIDDFEISSELFKCLPFSSFYIEIPENNLYHGAFVRYLSTSGLFICCVLAKDESFSVNVSIIETHAKYSEYENQPFENIMENGNKLDYRMSPELERIKKFIIQACTYLCAMNCDIRENEIQKGIYRPSKTVKNKYSEIRKWDVGYRVMREYKSIKSYYTNPENTVNTRKSPRMHWRKAHWHTFLCGEGRSERRLKFIAPILVNETFEDEIPVVNRQTTPSNRDIPF